MEQPSLSPDGEDSTVMTESPHSTNIESLPRQSGTRACAMCVKAKAKCTPHREIEGICQRYVTILWKQQLPVNGS